MKMKTFKPDQYIYKLKADEPIGEVGLGEPFKVDLKNGFGKTFNDVAKFDAFMKSSDKARLNHPCSGPILIEGVERDVSLVVHIRSLTASKIFQCLSKSTGLMRGEFEGRHPQIWESNGKGFINWNGVLVRERPSLGVLATLDETKRSCGRCCENGGNLDFPFLSIGAKVYLPVNHEEAQLAVGDLHLRQGFGEISGMGLEADGTAVLEIETTEKIPYPVIDTGN